MQMIYRISAVIILLMVLLVLSIDYLVFQGSYLLNKIAGGAVVDVLNSFGNLFQGPSAFTNLMFFAVISIGLLVGVVAMIYKFIKG